MTRFLLTRHASAAHVGRMLAGRAPGFGLDDEGRRQAGDLALHLAPAPIVAVHTGPLERARETAEPIAAVHGLPVRIDPAFDEVDFGAWTGGRFDELEGREDWRRWNEHRGSARPPGGESMADVVERALAGLRAIDAEWEPSRTHAPGVSGVTDEAAARRANPAVVVVSHCDVIRPLIAHFLGLSFDHILRFDVAPGSVSTVVLRAGGGRVLGVNRTIRPPWGAL